MGDGTFGGELDQPSDKSSVRFRLVSGSAWALLGKVLFAILAVAVNGVLARLLAPSQLGVYFLAVSLVGVFAVVSQLGLNHAGVRLVAESSASGAFGRARESARGVLAIGFAGGLLGGVVAAVVGRWLAEHLFHSPSLGRMMVLIALWIPIITMRMLIAEVFRGLSDIRLASLFGDGSQNTVLIILLVVVWLIGVELTAFRLILLVVAASVAVVLIAGGVLRRRLSALTGPGSITLKEIVTVAWPILLGNIATVALLQLDVPILSAFRSTREVALYGAAKRLVFLLRVPLLIVNAVVPPLIAALYAQGRKDQLERALRVTATIVSLPVLAALLLLFPFSGLALHLIFGRFYASAAPIVTILALGTFANVAAGSCGLALLMTGHQRTMMRLTFLSAGVTVVGAIVATRTLGSTGLAASMSGGLVLQNTLMVLAVRRRLGIWTHASLSFLSIRDIRLEARRLIGFLRTRS